MPWNPFDWTAGPFLTLYLTIATIIHPPDPEMAQGGRAGGRGRHSQ